LDSIIITFLSVPAIFAYSQWSYVFILFWIFHLQMIPLACIISVFFKHPKMAAVSAWATFLILCILNYLVHVETEKQVKYKLLMFFLFPPLEL